MASFFISHSSVDRVEAVAVRKWLTAHGHRDLFLSSEPSHGIVASAAWERELWLQLRAKRAVIFLASEASLESRWCFAELALARALGRPIFAVDIGGGIHPLLAAVQGITVDGDWGAAFERLAEDLHRVGLDAAELDWDPGRDPYPGLRPFTEQDAGVFFGRADETEALARELERDHVDPRPPFVAVVGASGSGKSSLVLAGLVPRLKQNADWLVAPALTADAAPTRTLAASLVAAGIKHGVTELRGRLKDNPASVVDDIAELLALAELPLDRGRMLVVVDQLERLFTITPQDERAAFAAALGALTEDADSPVAVCATLRAEFLREALAEEALVPVLRRTFPVGPIGPRVFRDVVTRPAERAAIAIEPELVDQIVADASGPDVLPLLSYTMQQLTEYGRAKRELTREAYDALGGVEGTLRRQADAALADLEARGFRRDDVLRELLRLVTVDPGQEATSRPVPAESLSGTGAAVIERFVDPARLLVSDGPNVRLAHEALVRAWAPLADAIAAHRAELEAVAGLRRAAAQWDEAGRTEGYLLSADRLDAGRRWRAGVAAGAAADDPLARELVAASEQRAAADLSWRADQLGRRVLAELDEGPELGLLLALAAVDEYAATDIALRALHEADRAWRGELAFADPDGPWVRAAWYRPSGTIVTVNSSGGSIREWDGESGEPIRTIRPANQDFTFVNGVALSRDGSTIALAVGTADTGRVELWHESGERLWAIDLDDEPARAVATSSDGRFVAIGGFNGLAVHDRDNATRREYPVTSVNAIAVAIDGETIVAGGYHNLVLVNAGKVTELERLEEDVQSVAFTADETRFVRVALDGTVVEYDLDQAPVPTVLATGLGWIFNGAYAPDEASVLVLGDRGELTLVGRDATQRTVVRRRSLGRAGALDPTGTRAVVSGSDSDVTVWDVRPDRAAVARFTAWEDIPMWDGSFSGREHVLIECGGRLRRTRLDGGEVWSTDVSPFPEWTGDLQGNYVVVRGDDVRLLTAATGDTAAKLAPDRRWSRFGFSRSGDELWAVDSDGCFVRWSVPSGILIAQLDLEVDDFVFDAAIGGGLVVLSARGLIAFDAETGVQRWRRSLDGSSHRPAFSPDETRLAVASESPLVSILDVTDGEPVDSIEHTERLNERSAYSPGFRQALWSPEGTRLALSGLDGTASVWNPATRGLLQAFVTTRDPLEAIEWSADGERLFAVGRENAVVWDAPPPDRLIGRARDRTWRSLTSDERGRYGLPSQLAP
jgi:WD40 repeat protein